MKRLLMFTAALELATGVALLIVPNTVALLLLGGGVNGEGLAIGRVAGVALLSLGLACWPASAAAPTPFPALGMLAYNVLVAGYFMYLGIQGEYVGVLLWPAAVLHGVLTLLLARTGIRSHRVSNSASL